MNSYHWRRSHPYFIVYGCSFLVANHILTREKLLLNAAPDMAVSLTIRIHIEVGSFIVSPSRYILA
jgi:hypothetical protein